MCGNALRCVTRYGNERGYLRADADVIMTDDGPKWVSAADGRSASRSATGGSSSRSPPTATSCSADVAHLVAAA